MKMGGSFPRQIKVLRLFLRMQQISFIMFWMEQVNIIKHGMFDELRDISLFENEDCKLVEENGNA